MDFLSQIRHRHSRQPLPITSSQYAISYPHQIHDVFVRAALSDLRSYDAFLCPSVCSKKAMENLLDHTYECLEQDFGLTLRYQPRCEVIPHGIDLEIFQPRDKRLARQELGLPEEGIFLLCVGRMTPSDKMDLHPLLLAFRQIRAVTQDQPVYLLLAGSDWGYGSRVKKTADEMGLRDAVILFGNLPVLGMPLVYSASDIFVLPGDNIQENFGLVLLEAAACGLPSVAADWSGYREIVKHEVTGFLVSTYWVDCDDALEEKGAIGVAAMSGQWSVDHLHLAQSVGVDVEALAKYLLLLIEQSELRLKMGEAARKHAVQQYSWKDVTQAHYALWEELHAQASQEAKGEEPAQGRHLYPRPFKNFGHYAGDLIDDSDSIEITNYGKSVLKRKHQLPIYTSVAENLNMGAMISALASLHWAKRFRMPMTVEQILISLQKQTISPSLARLHIVWMLKYNLIRRSSL
jgi:glycosyltransferase involved in cell wall biosynthesis